MKTTNQILIVDLEATCWENDRIPAGQKVDIIEIGICELTEQQKQFPRNKAFTSFPKGLKSTNFVQI